MMTISSTVATLEKNFSFNAFENKEGKIQELGFNLNDEFMGSVSFGANDTKIRLSDESINLLREKFKADVVDDGEKIKLQGKASEFVENLYNSLKDGIYGIAKDFASMLDDAILKIEPNCRPHSLIEFMQALLKAEVEGVNALSNQEAFELMRVFGNANVKSKLQKGLEELKQSLQDLMSDKIGLDNSFEKLDFSGEFKALKIDLATNILADMSKGFEV